ncbi:hypothetical protein ACHQM5_003863 [Ranunculus cassubicifolius]
MEPSIKESFTASEVLKCIHIGLLCVQKFPNDRPTMSTVLSMLDNGVLLPQPKQPGFYTEQPSLGLDSSSSKYVHFSTDEETVTLLQSG